MRNPFHKRRVTGVDQWADIRVKFPGFNGWVNHKGGVWTGALQPGPSSPRYSVEIRLPVNGRPKVWVRKPTLVQLAPHRYPDGSLCLYYPKDWCWHPGERLADSIIPWTALWLQYYELWLDTGKWLGPEVDHGTGEKASEG